MLCLPPANPELKGPEVYNAISIKTKRLEPAGRNFQEFYRRKYLKIEQEIQQENDSDKEEEKIDKEKLKQKRRKKSFVDLTGENYYEILELPSRNLVTEEMVKKQYKKMALKYHPDKQDTFTEDLKEILNAYETLTDETARRRYDSTLQFNDSIPSSFDKNTQNFYDLFFEYFDINSYWSKDKKVPQLGDEKTPIKKVQKFYDFWFNFESWREFQHEEEYDVNEAENRYERRYMEKENRKLKGELIKKEKERIKTLAKLAYDNDPRLIQHFEEIEKQKEIQRERKKKQKEEKIQQKILEQKRKEEEKKAEEELQAKQKQEKEDRLRQIEEQRALDKKNLTDSFLSLKEEGKLDQYYIAGAIDKLNQKEILFLTEHIKDNKIDSRSQFDKYYNKILKQKQKQKQEQELQKKLQEKQKQENKSVAEWSIQDISNLNKAMIKFPPGTHQRWERIERYLKSKFTVDDITEKVSQLKQQKNQQALKSAQVVWSQNDQNLLELALKKVPKNLSPKERWEKIAEMIPGKTMKDCVERFKYIKSQLKKQLINNNL